MKINNFVVVSNFVDKPILEKFVLLLYYFENFENLKEVEYSTISDSFVELGFVRPNTTRLKAQIKKSRKIIKGEGGSSYKLARKKFENLLIEYPTLSIASEVSVKTYLILPPELYGDTRGYIIKLSNQINSCYENGIFDGCVMLMRRLLEVCLVLTYEFKSSKSEIVDNNTGSIKNLSFIINHTVSNKKFNLNNTSYKVIDKFRVIGNLSAHRIQYNCTKTEIDNIKADYRPLIEELLYKSNIKK